MAPTVGVGITAARLMGHATGGVGAATSWVGSSTGGLGSVASWLGPATRMVASSAYREASAIKLENCARGGVGAATSWVGSSPCGEGNGASCTRAPSTGLAVNPCSRGGYTNSGSGSPGAGG